MPYYIIKNKEILNLFETFKSETRAAHKQAKQIIKELGGIDGRISTRGTLEGIKFKQKPDGKLWRMYGSKLGHTSNYYVPKRNSNAGKALYAKYKSIPIISKNELYKACGFKDAIFIGNIMHFGPALQVGKNKELIMIVDADVLLNKNYELPKDVKEITFEKYQKLRGDDQ